MNPGFHLLDTKLNSSSGFPSVSATAFLGNFRRAGSQSCGGSVVAEPSLRRAGSEDPHSFSSHQYPAPPAFAQSSGHVLKPPSDTTHTRRHSSGGSSHSHGHSQLARHNRTHQGRGGSHQCVNQSFTGVATPHAPHPDSYLSSHNNTDFCNLLKNTSPPLPSHLTRLLASLSGAFFVPAPTDGKFKAIARLHYQTSIPHSHYANNHVISRIPTPQSMFGQSTTPNQQSNTNSCISVDPLQRQITFFDPTTRLGGSNNNAVASAAHTSERKTNSLDDSSSTVGIGLSSTSIHNRAPKMFALDAIFGEDDSQFEVASCAVSDLIQSVVSGKDGCVVCLGHSKVGKTYTMIGESCQGATKAGIIPCSISWLFHVVNEVKRVTGARFSIRVSAVEVYGRNEQLVDLLAGVDQEGEPQPQLHSIPASNIYLRDDPISGTQLENYSELRVPTAQKAAHYLDVALKRRSTNKLLSHYHKGDEACESLESSSRLSHFFFTLHVYQYRVEQSGAQSGVTGGRSRLHLIDLGSGRTHSARANDSKNSGGPTTALSLAGIVSVLLALVNGQRHIPHRESKLSQLLREALGSLQCQTTVIGQISSHVQHHHDSLQITQVLSKMYRLRRRRAGPGQRLFPSGGSRHGSSTFSDSSSSCATDSTSSSGFRRSRLRHPQMGLFRAGSGWFSRSEGGCTSGSEMSCDTVIFVGSDGGGGYCTDMERPPSTPSNVGCTSTAVNNITSQVSKLAFENGSNWLKERLCHTETETETEDCSASVIGLTRAHSTQGTTSITSGLMQQRAIHGSAWSFHSCNVDTNTNSSGRNRRCPPRTNARVWPRISARAAIETLSTQKEQWVDGPKAVYRPPASQTNTPVLSPQSQELPMFITPGDPVSHNLVKETIPAVSVLEVKLVVEEVKANKNQIATKQSSGSTSESDDTCSCSTPSENDYAQGHVITTGIQVNNTFLNSSTSVNVPIQNDMAVSRTAPLRSDFSQTKFAMHNSDSSTTAVSNDDSALQHDSSTYSTIDRKNNRVLSDISERSGEAGSTIGVNGQLAGNHTDVDEDDEELLEAIGYEQNGNNLTNTNVGYIPGCRRLEDIQLPPLPGTVNWGKQCNQQEKQLQSWFLPNRPPTVPSKNNNGNKNSSVTSGISNYTPSQTSISLEKLDQGKSSHQSTPTLPSRRSQESLPQVETLNSDLARVRQWIDKMNPPQSPKSIDHEMQQPIHGPQPPNSVASSQVTNSIANTFSNSLSVLMGSANSSPMIKGKLTHPSAVQPSTSTTAATTQTSALNLAAPYVCPMSFPPPPPHFTPERWHQWIMMVQLFLGLPLPTAQNPMASNLLQQSQDGQLAQPGKSSPQLHTDSSQSTPGVTNYPASWMQLPFLFPSFDPSAYYPFSSVSPSINAVATSKATPFGSRPSSQPSVTNVNSQPTTGNTPLFPTSNSHNSSPKHETSSSSVILNQQPINSLSPPTVHPIEQHRSQSCDNADAFLSPQQQRHSHIERCGIGTPPQMRMGPGEWSPADKRTKKKGKSTDCGGRWLFGLSKSRRKSIEQVPFSAKGVVTTPFDYHGPVGQTGGWSSTSLQSTPHLPVSSTVPQTSHQHQQQPLQSRIPLHLISPYSIVTAPIPANQYRACRSMVTGPITGHGSSPVEGNSSASAIFAFHDGAHRHGFGGSEVGGFVSSKKAPRIPGGGGSKSVVSQPTSSQWAAQSTHQLQYPSHFPNQQSTSSNYPYLMMPSMPLQQATSKMFHPTLPVSHSHIAPPPQRAQGSSGYESMVAARDASEVSSCANSDQGSLIAVQHPRAAPSPCRGMDEPDGNYRHKTSKHQLNQHQSHPFPSEQQQTRRPRKSRHRSEVSNNQHRASSMPPNASVTTSSTNISSARGNGESRVKHKRQTPSCDNRNVLSSIDGRMGSRMPNDGQHHYHNSARGSDSTPINLSTMTLQHQDEMDGNWNGSTTQHHPPQRRMILTEMMERQIRQEKIAQLAFEQELLKQEMVRVLALMPDQAKPNFTDFQKVLKTQSVEDPNFIPALEKETKTIREWINACKSRFMLVTSFDAKTTAHLYENSSPIIPSQTPQMSSSKQNRTKVLTKETSGNKLRGN